MDYVVLVNHAVDLGNQTVEPYEEFSDKDVDKDELKRLEELGQIGKVTKEVKSEAKQKGGGE